MHNISVIIPIKNEEESIYTLYNKLKKTLDSLKAYYEIIFINDGSTDDSFNKIKKLKANDKSIRLINLARSYGQSNAFQAGFDNANGDIIVAIDGDNENDPADIIPLYNKLNEGYDVVCGKRIKKNHHLIDVLSIIEKLIVKILFHAPVWDITCPLRIYKKKILKGLVINGVYHRFLPIILLLKGAKITEVNTIHYKRKYGKSKYNPFKKMLITIKTIFILIFNRNKILKNKRREYDIIEIY